MNDELSRLISKNENWLMRRILEYAKRFHYSQYTSTLEEAWRISIQGLSQELLAALERGSDASRTRSRPGLRCRSHGRFRHSGSAAPPLARHHPGHVPGADEVLPANLSRPDQGKPFMAAAAKKRYLLFIERFFDRVEIGFCSEWCSHGAGRLAAGIAGRQPGHDQRKEQVPDRVREPVAPGVSSGPGPAGRQPEPGRRRPHLRPGAERLHLLQRRLARQTPALAERGTRGFRGRNGDRVIL